MAGTSKKSRKHDRNRASCKAYAASSRREKNKVKRLDKHLKKFPHDRTALASREACVKIIRGY